MISRHDTDVHLKDIFKFQRRNREHPALVMLLADLDQMLASSTGYQLPRQLRQVDWKPRLMKELQRMHNGGITGNDVFRAVAMIYLLSHRQPSRLEMNSREMKFAIARAVLHLRNKGTKKGRMGVGLPHRMSTHVLDHLGHQLLIKALPVLQPMATALDRIGASAHRERRDEIAAAIAEKSFAEPSPDDAISQTYARLVAGRQRNRPSTTQPTN